MGSRWETLTQECNHSKCTSFNSLYSTVPLQTNRSKRFFLVSWSWWLAWYICGVLGIVGDGEILFRFFVKIQRKGECCCKCEMGYSRLIMVVSNRAELLCGQHDHSMAWNDDQCSTLCISCYKKMYVDLGYLLHGQNNFVCEMSLFFSIK